MPFNLAINQIHGGRTDEASNEKIGRMVIEIKRSTNLLYNTAVHHDNAVCHGHGFDLIMGDIDHRRFKPSMQSLDLGSHLHTKLCIQVGQGLVEEKHFWVANNGAPHGDALPLAARELTRGALQERCKRKNVRSTTDTFVNFRFWRIGKT